MKSRRCRHKNSAQTRREHTTIYTRVLSLADCTKHYVTPSLKHWRNSFAKHWVSLFLLLKLGHGKKGKYCVCWCPSSLRHQVISSHGINYVGYAGPSLSTTLKTKGCKSDKFIVNDGWHCNCKLTFRQFTVPSLTTNLSNWQPFIFSEKMILNAYTFTMLIYAWKSKYIFLFSPIN